MAVHSGILAWEFPWSEEPGRLQSMGLQKGQIRLSYYTTTKVLRKCIFCNWLGASKQRFDFEQCLKLSRICCNGNCILTVTFFHQYIVYSKENTLHVSSPKNSPCIVPL